MEILKNEVIEQGALLLAVLLLLFHFRVHNFTHTKKGEKEPKGFIGRIYLVFHSLTGLGFEMNFWEIPQAGGQLL